MGCVCYKKVHVLKELKIKQNCFQGVQKLSKLNYFATKHGKKRGPHFEQPSCEITMLELKGAHSECEQ